jgi:hypothetical protein
LAEFAILHGVVMWMQRSPVWFREVGLCRCYRCELVHEFGVRAIANSYPVPGLAPMVCIMLVPAIERTAGIAWMQRAANPREVRGGNGALSGWSTIRRMGIILGTVRPLFP